MSQFGLHLTFTKLQGQLCFKGNWQLLNIILEKYMKDLTTLNASLYFFKKRCNLCPQRIAMSKCTLFCLVLYVCVSVLNDIKSQPTSLARDFQDK